MNILQKQENEKDIRRTRNVIYIKNVQNSLFKIFFVDFPSSLIYFFFCLMKTGEQASQVLGIYVESSVMGHGNRCIDGHWISQWRGNYI